MSNLFILALEPLTMVDCAFCDSSKHADKIVYESDHFYAMPTIGQISDGGHMLLISKAHEPCLGALTQEHFDELIDVKNRLQGALRNEYGKTIAFEHGIIGQSVPHAHLQMLPSSTDLYSALKRDYPFHKALSCMDEIKGIYTNRRVYLYYENQQEEKFGFYMDAIPQYLRLIAAKEMGRTPRGNWKEWRADPDCAKIDEQLMGETVHRLKRIIGR